MNRTVHLLCVVILRQGHGFMENYHSRSSSNLLSQTGQSAVEIRSLLKLTW